MPEGTRVKYRLKGLDCAQCASDIETKLNSIDNLQEVTVNFAAGSVMMDPSIEDKARATIADTHPYVQLLSPNERVSTSVNVSWYRNSEILRLLFSSSLFLAGILFHNKLASTSRSFGIYAVFLPAYLISGWPVLVGAFKNIIRGRVFDELFLMTVASFGAIIIGEVPEAVGVMLFFSVGSFVEDRAVARSRRSIVELMDHRPDVARVVDDDGVLVVNPELVPENSLIEIRAGEVFPFDGVVQTGKSFVDTSALTGEPVRRAVEPGDDVMAGTINDNGMLRVRTTASFGESTVAKILNLVEDAATRKAPPEKFISKFARVYTPIVVGAAALVALVPPIAFGASFEEWLYRALVMLVISCPCALVVSIPLGYFGGIGRASAAKILVKGSNVIDALREVRSVVFDKTGTLTEGDFKVRGITPNGETKEETVIDAAALAESVSHHPIAEAIRLAAQTEVESSSILSSREEKGFGVVTEIGNRIYAAGSREHLEREGVVVDVPESNDTTVFVAKDGIYLGFIRLSDDLKKGAKETVKTLSEIGIKRQIMLTGDNELRARSVAEDVGIHEVSSRLLPGGKVEALGNYMNADNKELTMFIGDGLNDAPVIVHADIGVAMGGLGSDAAIEAADMVIMDDDIRRIPEAIRIARFTRRIVFQNIFFALGLKAAFLLLGAAGIASMWVAVIGDVGVALLALLNATRILRFKLPNV